MKHLVLIVAALFAAAVGVDVLHLTHGSTPGLIVGAALVLVALLLAVPAQMGEARTQLTAAWQAFKNPQSAGSGAKP